MLRWLKNTLKLLLILAVLSIIPPFLAAYQYFMEHPTKRYVYESGEEPEEVKEKLRLVKPIQHRLWISLGLLAAFIYVDYKHNPKDHIFEKLRRPRI